MQTNTIPTTPLKALPPHQTLVKQTNTEWVNRILAKEYPDIEPFPGTKSEILDKATGIFINPDDNNWQFLTENITDPKEIDQDSIDECYQFSIEVNGKILPVFEY